MDGGIPIPESADMNSDTYKTPGNYFCSSSTVANSLKNVPFSNAAFTLKVGYSTGKSYPSQTFKAYRTGKVAYRMYDAYSQEWSDWLYFSDDAAIFVGTPINSGDDLNDYTTPGIYRSTSSGITASLLNIPETFVSGFTMLVFNMLLATNVQVIFAGDRIYMRLSNTSGWQSWFKYSGTVISS